MSNVERNKENAIKVKKHTKISSQSDWKSLNTEEIKKYNSQSKYSIERFKEKNLFSNIIGSDKYKEEKIVSESKKMDKLNLMNGGINKLKQASKKDVLKNITDSKNKKMCNLASSFDIVKNIDFPLSIVSNASTCNNSSSLSNKYEIVVSKQNDNTNQLCPEEIKKILDKKGIHAYNVKVENLFTNGNINPKLKFEVRNEDRQKITELKDFLNEKGAKISNKNIEIKNIDYNSALMFPVKAKWIDTNLRYYHISDENKKLVAPISKTNKAKANDIHTEYDKQLLTYKNDRKNAKLPKTKEKQ